MFVYIKVRVFVCVCMHVCVLVVCMYADGSFFPLVHICWQLILSSFHARADALVCPSFRFQTVPLDDSLAWLGDHVLPMFGLRGACAIFPCWNRRKQSFKKESILMEREHFKALQAIVFFPLIFKKLIFFSLNQVLEEKGEGARRQWAGEGSTEWAE